MSNTTLVKPAVSENIETFEITKERYENLIQGSKFRFNSVGRFRYTFAFTGKQVHFYTLQQAERQYEAIVDRLNSRISNY